MRSKRAVYVRLTDAELDELEAESNSSIDLKEFIPIKKIDPVYFERAYYLGAEEAGSKAYRLLADEMGKSGRVALVEMIFHNREKLVLIRPMKGGLVLQFIYHEEEVRDFDEIAKAEGERLTPAEFELATGLVEKLSAAEFEPEAYTDEYRARVKNIFDQKAKGQEITIAPPAPPSGQSLTSWHR
jgi:DNA end-binding protein Ku